MVTSNQAKNMIGPSYMYIKEYGEQTASVHSQANDQQWYIMADGNILLQSEDDGCLKLIYPPCQYIKLLYLLNTPWDNTKSISENRYIKNCGLTFHGLLNRDFQTKDKQQEYSVRMPCLDEVESIPLSSKSQILVGLTNIKFMNMLIRVITMPPV